MQFDPNFEAVFILFFLLRLTQILLEDPVKTAEVFPQVLELVLEGDHDRDDHGVRREDARHKHPPDDVGHDAGGVGC